MLKLYLSGYHMTRLQRLAAPNQRNISKLSQNKYKTNVNKSQLAKIWKETSLKSVPLGDR
jgi:hypothetical protein